MTVTKQTGYIKMGAPLNYIVTVSNLDLGGKARQMLSHKTKSRYR